MKDFAGKIAVVTGGGTGMGRELARQLVAEGCHVAMCDVSDKNMAQTIALAKADGVPQGVRITAHHADVSDESQLQRFRDEIAEQHDTRVIHLLFNNAGIGGGGSVVNDDRAGWEVGGGAGRRAGRAAGGRDDRRRRLGRGPGAAREGSEDQREHGRRRGAGERAGAAAGGRAGAEARTTARTVRRHGGLRS